MKKITMILAGTVVCLSLVFAAGTAAEAKIKVKKPTITVKKKTKSSIKLQISSKNKKLTGYKIYRMKVDDSGIFTINLGWKKLKTIKVKSGKKKVSYTVKKLKANTKYKFKVEAYRSYKGKKGKAAKTKSVKTLKATKPAPKPDDDKKDDKKEGDITIPNNKDTGSNYQQKMLDKVNQYRREAGVQELKLNQDLCNIALMRCKAEGIHENFTEQFKDYYESKGLVYYYDCSENMGGGYGGDNLPMLNADNTWEIVLDEWMDSSHKKNILKNEWTYFGCAYYEGTWYQTFENRNVKTYFWDDCDERGDRAIHRYHTTTGRYPEGMDNWCPVCAMGN